MQKNEIKGCCQAESHEQEQKQGQGPLPQQHKKSSFFCSALRLPLFSGIFFSSFNCHYERVMEKIPG
jgi:hypothetical protein